MPLPDLTVNLNDVVKLSHMIHLQSIDLEYLHTSKFPGCIRQARFCATFPTAVVVDFRLPRVSATPRTHDQVHALSYTRPEGGVGLAKPSPAPPSVESATAL